MIAKQSERSRVLCTKDYSIFKLNQFKVDPKHLNQMLIEMRQKNLSRDLPIMVDENYNVLDGRYRFHVNRILDEPVYYKIAEVGNAIDFAVAKDLCSRYSSYEYALMHSDSVHYRILMEHASSFPFGFRVFMAVIGVRGNRYSEKYSTFKRGGFVWTDIENDITANFLQAYDFCKKIFPHNFKMKLLDRINDSGIPGELNGIRVSAKDILSLMSNGVFDIEFAQKFCDENREAIMLYNSVIKDGLSSPNGIPELVRIEYYIEDIKANRGRAGSSVLYWRGPSVEWILHRAERRGLLDSVHSDTVDD